MSLPPPDPGSTCVVTGASSGIGRDIARELAARGHGITLVARREDRLKALAEELERGGARIEAIAADVSDEASRTELAREVEARGLTVDVLVNNAGFGSAGPFVAQDKDAEVRMVRTNAEAVVALCGEYAPQMVDRGRGAILNVASIAGFQPLPRQATYSATKAFVVTFTDALHAELSGTGVTVTALCPGPVPTEFSAVAGLDDEMSSLPGPLVTSSKDTARAAVKALERGRRTVAPGAVNTVTALAGQHTPRSVLLPLLRRFYPVDR